MEGASVATYVLVGGAWLGGWAWKEVARNLRAKGHDVYPATLTGLGERVHLGSPETDLETHITDVVNLIEFEDLTDVILSGHSYSGMVVTGIADRVPDRLAQLVFVDAAPFEDGEKMFDFNSPEGQVQLQHEVDTHGDGWKMAVPTAKELGEGASIRGLGENELALFEAKATPHPFGTYEQPLCLKNPGAGKYGRVIIACDDFHAMKEFFVERFAQFKPPVWRIFELDTGHWPMLSMPNELADIFDELATG